MSTKALMQSFKYNRRSIRTVCYTLSHIIEIDIDAINPLLYMSTGSGPEDGYVVMSTSMNMDRVI
jgi:hypothetical protein